MSCQNPTANRAIRSARLSLATCLCAGLMITSSGTSAAQEASPDHFKMAKEVTDAIIKDYWMPKEDLFRGNLNRNDPETVWGAGVLFSMMAGAARHEPKVYGRDMMRFYNALDRYWDTEVKIPGYEPAPTRGGGNDKYYDDNAWMVMCFAEAYQLTGTKRLIRRADETLEFVLSGWDDTLGGGIWWHEKHKGGTKNTCANAPAAVACLVMAKHRPDKRQERIDMSRKIMEWTRKTFQAKDGLYSDSIHFETLKINHDKLTYNTALMLRAELMMHRITGEESYLREAERLGKVADKLCFSGTGVYRDPARWSHLMVEADLELYRHTGWPRALERARANADAYYASWKNSEKPLSLIDQSSIARGLWLVVDHQTPVGQAFWKEADKP